jgi:hypothetical protein
MRVVIEDVRVDVLKGRRLERVFRIGSESEAEVGGQRTRSEKWRNDPHALEGAGVWLLSI